MKPIAVFYHCRISGGDPPIDFDHGSDIMGEQMQELNNSGLTEAASHMYVGVNGHESDLMVAQMLAPAKAEVHLHRDGRSELPTLHVLQSWLPEHKDWHVLYHHTKCATRQDPSCYVWRRRMQHHLVTNWRRAVQDLENGAEAVGCHWLTPEAYPGLVGTPYFGGTFFFARSDYLMTLPKLPDPTWANRYEAEAWIGKGPKRPRIVDYAPGWPM